MIDFFSPIRPLLFALPAETAHRLTLRALASGLVPAPGQSDDPILRTRFLGFDLTNPFGLAAGFDKSARAWQHLHALGFGFVELGGVTPRPQAGNPRPRLFRLVEDRAVINRMGFNNDGMEAVASRLVGRARPEPVGMNLASNTDTRDPIGDFVTLARRFAALVDYLTLDISCPNTANGQVFLDPAALADLLGALAATFAECGAPRRVPLLGKLGPDIEETRLARLVETLLNGGIDGLILSNTTRARPPGLRGSRAGETGGLSGPPLFAATTEQLRRVYAMTGGRLPLIGAGGISSGADAYAKIRAGASALQLYTALVYEGPAGLWRIKCDLAQRLRADGHRTLKDAVGTDFAHGRSASTTPC